MERIECIDPKCSGTPISRPHFSTWAVDVHFCPECKRVFSIPTWLGKLRDFAPTVLAGCAVIGLGMEIDHLEQATNLSSVDDVFGGGVS